MFRIKLTLLIIMLAMQAICVADSHAMTLFYDDFSGDMLDSEKWNVRIKGGDYDIADGYLYMSSSSNTTGNGFPAITAVNDPFPADSDWTFSSSLRYTSGPNNYGDGISIYEAGSTNKIAYIWQDRRGGGFYLRDEVSGNLLTVWSGDAASSFRTFTLENTGDLYEAYVDGELAGSAFNTALPGRLVLGNDDVGDLYGRWNPFMIDFVSVATADTPPVPAPEPGTLMLTATGMIGIISRYFLRLMRRLGNVSG